jgi:hypothetical protein
LVNGSDRVDVEGYHDKAGQLLSFIAVVGRRSVDRGRQLVMRTGRCVRVLLVTGAVMLLVIVCVRLLVG